MRNLAWLLLTVWLWLPLHAQAQGTAPSPKIQSQIDALNATLAMVPTTSAVNGLITTALAGALAPSSLSTAHLTATGGSIAGVDASGAMVTPTGGSPETLATAIGAAGLSSSAVNAMITTALTSLGWSNPTTGGDGSLTGAVVTSGYGNVLTPLGRAVSQAGMLNLVSDFGAAMDHRSGSAPITATAGSHQIVVAAAGSGVAGAPLAFVAGVDDASDRFGHPKHIVFGHMGARGTGKLAAIPVGVAGEYDQSGFPSIVLSNVGSGSGALPTPVWQVSKVFVVSQGSGCVGNGLFYSGGGGESGTFVQTSIVNGQIAEAVGAQMSIVPYAAGNTNSGPGYWIDSPPGGNTQAYPLLTNQGTGTYCLVPPTVQFHFALVGTTFQNNQGSGYAAATTPTADGTFASSVVASLSGGGTPITPATLGTVPVIIAAPPWSTTITSVVNATTINVADAVPNAPPSGAIDYHYFHDDTPAWTAAAAYANAPLTMGGAPRPIYLPPGTSGIEGKIPTFTSSGGITGTGMQKSWIFVDPASGFTGDVVSCDGSTHITNIPNPTSTPSPWSAESINQTTSKVGCQMHDFSITGMLDGANRENCYTLAGVEDNFDIGNVGCTYMPGSALRWGVLYGSETFGYIAESTFDGELWFRDVGFNGACVVDAGGQGTGDAVNEINGNLLMMYNPRSLGICVHNENTNTGSAGVKWNVIRIENSEASTGFAHIPADEFDFGTKTMAGGVGAWHIGTLRIVTVNQWHAGLRTDCPANASIINVPGHLQIDRVETFGGGNLGVPLDLECSKLSQIGYYGGDPGKAFDFKIGDIGSNPAAPRVGLNQIKTDMLTSYTFGAAQDAVATNLIPLVGYGDPGNPAGWTILLPGQVTVDSLNLRGVGVTMGNLSIDGVPSDLATAMLNSTSGGGQLWNITLLTGTIVPGMVPSYSGVTVSPPDPVISVPSAGQLHMTTGATPPAGATITFADTAGYDTCINTYDNGGALLNPCAVLVSRTPGGGVVMDTPKAKAAPASGATGLGLATLDWTLAKLSGMTSGVSSVFARNGAVVAASGDYSVGQVTGAAPLASPAFSGTPTTTTTVPGTGGSQIASQAYADNSSAAAASTVAGLAALRANNLSDLSNVANARTNLGLGSIATQSAALFAPLASPAFTGSPTTPTSTPGTGGSQVASQAYSDISSAAAATTVSGLAALRANNLSDLSNAANARTNLGLGSIATQSASLFAPLASPAFTGSPTAPTQSPGDGSTKIANDAFVAAATAGLSPCVALPGGWKTGNFYGAALTANPGSAAITANRMYAIPVCIPNAVTLNSLSIGFGATSVAANGRERVFADSGAGKPGSQIADTGQFTIASGLASGTALTETLGTPVAISTPGIYWFSVTTDTAETLAIAPTATVGLIGSMMGSSTAANALSSSGISNGYYATGSVSTTISTFGTAVQAFGLAVPLCAGGV